MEEIFRFGKNVKDIKPEDKEQIGVVLSDSGFSRYLTVKDIKDILKNTYEAFDEQLFTNYIEKYQLPTDKKLEQFSVGMKAKLKLITAICHKAKLLILDVKLGIDGRRVWSVYSLLLEENRYMIHR